MAAIIDVSARRVTYWNHIRAILLLPVMNTVLIPSVLLFLYQDAAIGMQSRAIEWMAIVLALPFLAAGVFLVSRSIMLFIRYARGTLAPWDPTEVLLTSDLYQYTRNPMKLGLFLVLMSEVILLRSAAITVWACAFITMNVLYISWFEEPGLRSRFGDRYQVYCHEVPRWFSLRWLTETPGRARRHLS